MLCPRCHREVLDTWAHCPYDATPLEPMADPISIGSLHHKMTGLAGVIVGGRFQIKGFVHNGATSRGYLPEDLKRKQRATWKRCWPRDGRTPATPAGSRPQ